MTKPLLHQSKTVQGPGMILLVTICYFISGKLGLLFALPNTNATVLWPPSGIALAAVLLLGYRSALAVFFGSFLLNINTLFELSSFMYVIHVILASCGIGIGAALQAIVGAYLIQKIIPDKKYFKSPESVILFLLMGLLSCLINSNVGTSSTIAGGFIPWESYFVVWRTWFIGDVGGVFIFTPLIICFIQFFPKKIVFRSVFEAALLLTAILITAWLNHLEDAHFSYLYLPWLIWAAMRFGLFGTTLTLTITVLIVIWSNVYGLGPFKSLISLELFIIVISAMILALAAELERERPATTVWEGHSKKVNRILDFFRRFRKK